jgi:kynurenine formamidase
MGILDTKQLRYVDLSYKIYPVEGEIAPDDYVRLVLDEALVWPLKTYDSYVDDTVYQVVKMKTHVKTHTESPYHLDKKGPPLSAYTPETFIGRAVIFFFDAGPNAIITREMIERRDNGRLQKGDIAIVHTSWTKDQGGEKPEILKDAGQYFLDKRIKYFGQDESLSIFRNGADSTHDLLLKNKIPLLEMLINLDKLTQDVVFLIAIPGLMKVEGIDSSTTQVVAIEGLEVL